MFTPCVSRIKILFIVPTDAHYHKIVDKTLKIVTFAPTRFGSLRNHHEGAVLCLAKTAEYGLLCCWAGVRFTVATARQPNRPIFHHYID
jgi:hypothetical protein